MNRKQTGQFFSGPLLRFIIIFAVSLTILLTVIPFIFSKFVPKENNTDDSKSQNTTFKPVVIPDTITVYRTETGGTESVDFEEYIKGVAACEMPSSFHTEALKAQSVAARTYSAAKVLNAEISGNPETHPSAPVCDSTHCQVYKNEYELKEQNGNTWMNTGWKKICKAVNTTKGELLYYNGELVKQALFHSSSGGKTENSEDVFASAYPYLVSVDSPYENEATHQNEKNSFTLDEFAEKMQSAYPNINFGAINASNIKIISRSSGGRVEKMQIGGGIIEGTNIREVLSLPSANFTIDISGNTVIFTSNGSGHGVGMSQYGADGMAENGYNYKEILNHYYRGTTVY